MENGGRKVGQRLWWFFDGLEYKGDVGWEGEKGNGSGGVQRDHGVEGGKDNGSVGHAEGHGFVWGCNGAIHGLGQEEE